MKKWSRKTIAATVLTPIVALLLIATVQAIAINSRLSTQKKEAAAAAVCSIDRQAFLSGVNSWRAHKGLQPLSYSTRLENAAKERISDMEQNQYYGHTNPKTKVQSYTVAFQYDKAATAAGEVLDAPNSAQESLQNFKNSPEHYAVLTDAKYNFVGFSSAHDAESWASYDNSGNLETPAGKTFDNCTVIGVVADKDGEMPKESTTTSQTNIPSTTQRASSADILNKTAICAQINSTGESAFQSFYSTEANLLDTYSGDNRESYKATLNQAIVSSYNENVALIERAGCGPTIVRTLLP